MIVGSAFTCSCSCSCDGAGSGSCSYYFCSLQIYSSFLGLHIAYNILAAKHSSKQRSDHCVIIKCALLRAPVKPIVVLWCRHLVQAAVRSLTSLVRSFCPHGLLSSFYRGLLAMDVSPFWWPVMALQPPRTVTEATTKHVAVIRRILAESLRGEPVGAATLRTF